MAYTNRLRNTQESYSFPSRFSRHTQRTLWLSHPSDRAILVDRGILPVLPSAPKREYLNILKQRELSQAESTVSVLSTVEESKVVSPQKGSDLTTNVLKKRHGLEEPSSLLYRDNCFSSSGCANPLPKKEAAEGQMPSPSSAKETCLPNELLTSLHQAQEVIHTLTSLFPILSSRVKNIGSSQIEIPSGNRKKVHSASPTDSFASRKKTLGDGIAWLDFVHPTESEISTVLSWMAPALPHLMVATRHWIYLHQEEGEARASLPPGENEHRNNRGGDFPSRGGASGQTCTEENQPSSVGVSFGLPVSTSPRPPLLRRSADFYWDRSTASDMNHLVFYPSYGYGLLRFTALRAPEEKGTIYTHPLNETLEPLPHPTKKNNSTEWFAPSSLSQSDSTSSSSSSSEEGEGKRLPFSDPFVVVSCILLDRAMITFRNGYFKDEDELISELQWCFGYYSSLARPCNLHCGTGTSLPYDEASRGTGVEDEGSPHFSFDIFPTEHYPTALLPVLPAGQHRKMRNMFFTTNPSSPFPWSFRSSASSFSSSKPPREPYSEPLFTTTTAAASTCATARIPLSEKSVMRSFVEQNVLSTASPAPSTTHFALPHHDHHLIPLLVSTMISFVVDEFKQATIPLLIETNHVDELALSIRPSPEDQEDVLRRMRSVRHRIHQWHIQLLRKEALLQQLLASTQNGKQSQSLNGSLCWEHSKGGNIHNKMNDASSYKLRHHSRTQVTERIQEEEGSNPSTAASTKPPLSKVEWERNTEKRTNAETKKSQVKVEIKEGIDPSYADPQIGVSSCSARALSKDFDDGFVDNIPEEATTNMNRVPFSSVMPAMQSAPDVVSKKNQQEQRHQQSAKIMTPQSVNMKIDDKENSNNGTPIEHSSRYFNPFDMRKEYTLVLPPFFSFSALSPHTTLEEEVVARYLHALTLTKLAIENIRRGRDTINFSSMSVISGVVAQLSEHGHLTDYWNTLQAVIALLVIPVNIIPGIMSCNFAVPFENSNSKSVFWIIVAIAIGLLVLGLAYPVYCYYRYKLPGSIAPL